MSKTRDEKLDAQRAAIIRAKQALNCPLRGLAELIDTPYPTLLDWKAGRYIMPGVAYVALRYVSKDPANLARWAA